MKRIFLTVMVVCFAFSSAFSYTNRTSILFCTTDLSSSASKELPTDKSFDDSNNFILVESQDSLTHKQFRHCFNLLGRQIEGEGSQLLEVWASAGYYNIGDSDIGMVIDEKWLLDREARKNYTISCTPVIEENMPCGGYSDVITTRESDQGLEQSYEKNVIICK
jgi:hypothetical protein